MDDKIQSRIVVLFVFLNQVKSPSPEKRPYKIKKVRVERNVLPQQHCFPNTNLSKPNHNPTQRNLSEK